MGRFERRAALTVAGLLALATPNAAAVPLTLEVRGGSPFTAVGAKVGVVPGLDLGLHWQLIDGLAVRTGLDVTYVWLAWGPVQLAAELSAARAFGIDVTSTWDASIVSRLRIGLDQHSTVVLDVGALGYLGAEADQRGVIGQAALTVWRAFSAGVELGFELGWMVSQAAHRPMGSVRLRWTLPLGDEL